jgi:hypothetical protein
MKEQQLQLSGERASSSANFGVFFMRYLMDKDSRVSKPANVPTILNPLLAL